jgi:hypothetical protein
MQRVDGVTILWLTDYWDGPVRGVASRGDRHYWFAAVFDKAQDDFEYPRRLLLYELSDDDLREEWERHLRFESEVGDTRGCFHLPSAERHGPDRPQESWAKFYERERTRPQRDYESRSVAGWFSPD